MAHTRVAIFTDDPFVREGLGQLLRAVPTLALRDIDPKATPALDPAHLDIVLVDSRTEGALEQCTGRDGGGPFLIFVSVPDDAWGVRALGAGARGIVRKQEPITDVVRAIDAVVDGRVWAPRHVILDAWLRHRSGAAPDARATMVKARLTSRECDVVRYVTQGLSNKEVAARLSISTTTVKAHLTHIFTKLDVQGRGELTATYAGALDAHSRREWPARRRQG